MNFPLEKQVQLLATCMIYKLHKHISRMWSVIRQGAFDKYNINTVSEYSKYGYRVNMFTDIFADRITRNVLDCINIDDLWMMRVIIRYPLIRAAHYPFTNRPIWFPTHTRAFCVDGLRMSQTDPLTVSKTVKEWFTEGDFLLLNCNTVLLIDTEMKTMSVDFKTPPYYTLSQSHSFIPNKMILTDKAYIVVLTSTFEVMKCRVIIPQDPSCIISMMWTSMGVALTNEWGLLPSDDEAHHLCMTSFQIDDVEFVVVMNEDLFEIYSITMDCCVWSIPNCDYRIDEIIFTTGPSLFLHRGDSMKDTTFRFTLDENQNITALPIPALIVHDNICRNINFTVRLYRTSIGQHTHPLITQYARGIKNTLQEIPIYV